MWAPQKKRYSEFDDLAGMLADATIDGKHIHVPSLPGKTLFSAPIDDAEFMNNRREGLEKFLFGLLDQRGVPGISGVQAFLHLDDGNDSDGE